MSVYAKMLSPSILEMIDDRFSQRKYFYYDIVNNLKSTGSHQNESPSKPIPWHGVSYLRNMVLPQVNDRYHVDVG